MKLDFSITDWYAFGLAIILSLLALRRAIATVFRFICPLAFQIWNFQAFYRIRKRVSQWSVKHLVYRSFFRHGSSLDTFTRAHTILFLSYLVSNLGYVLINTLDTAEAFSRAGVLAVINAVLLYVGPCLDFVATVLHLRLRIQKQIHATAGYMVAVLCTIHAAGIFSRYGWSAMDETHNLLAALALLGVYLMLIPMKALPAVFPYEFLLFTHHSMSVMIGYAIWRHIPADNHRIRVFLYGIAGIFLSSLALQTLVTLYRNHFWFQSVSLSKNGSFDYIQVKLTLRKPVKVEPGQYINLWIPLGPISSIQSHPFTVANWSPDAQKELKLFVEVNNGLTKTLRGRVELGLTSNIGIFTGPYGSRITVENYETIILIATGLGVVALTPYLQWLVHAARMREVRIAPVHLVWQIPSWKQSHAVFDVIDFALALDEKEDNLGEGKEAGVMSKSRSHAVNISMYYEEAEPLPPKVQLFIKDMKKKEEEMGGKTRVKVYQCQLPLRNVLLSETVMSSTHDHSGKPTLIAASVPRTTRNTLVDFAREHSRAVDLVFTDYQP